MFKWILQNILTKENIELNKPINSAGRTSDFEIVCNSNNVSRKHAKFLILSDGSLHIQDLNSSNGTFVNSKKIEPQILVQLHYLDEVGLGVCKKNMKNVLNPYIFIVIKNSVKSNDTTVLIQELSKNSNEQIVNDNLCKSNSDFVKLNDDEDCCIVTSTNTLEGNVNKFNYSLDDEVIILSDENEDFLCSQLFKADDAAESFITDNIFMNIKNEISDMDKFDQIPDPILIDDDDDDLGINNTEELLSILGEEDKNQRKASTICYSSDLELNISPVYHPEASDIFVPSVISELRKDFKTNSPDNSKILKSPLSTETCSDFNLNNPQSSIAWKKKCLPPMIIEPHREEKKRKSSKRETKEGKKSIFIKKNGSDEINQTDSVTKDSKIIDQKEDKKERRSLKSKEIFKKSYGTSKVKTAKNSLEDYVPAKRAKKCVPEAKISNFIEQNVNKEERRSLRSLKLKEIAEKSSITSRVKISKNSPVKAKVKNESRGDFLLGHVPAKRARKSSPEVTLKRSLIEVESKSSFNSDSNVDNMKRKVKNKTNLVMESEKNIGVNTKNEENFIVKCKKNITVTNEENIVSKNIKKFVKKDKNNQTKNNLDEINVKNLTEINKKNSTEINKKDLDKNCVFHIESINNSVLPQVNILDIVMDILHWPTKWLEEQRNSKDPPPVTKIKPKKMKMNFESYNDYYDTVIPLLTLELWYSIFKDYDNFSQKNFKEKTMTAQITSVNYNKENKYITMQCFYYMTRKQNENTKLREEDLILIQIPIKEETRKNSHKKVFGFVSHCQKSTLKKTNLIDFNFAKNLNGVPETIVTTTVKIKYFESKISIQEQCYIRLITSLTSSLRIFKSVKYLNYSSLRDYILKPLPQHYYMDNIPRSKIISKVNLNENQKVSVLEATHICTRNKPGIYLLQGPPGTGKSTVITSIVQQILFQNDFNKNICILLVAPSNAAVDELTYRLVKIIKPHLTNAQKKNLKVVRVGPKNMIRSDVISYSLDNLIQRNLIDYFNRKPYCIDLIKQMENLKHEIVSARDKNICTKEKEERLQQLGNKLENIIQSKEGSYYKKLYKEKEAILLNGANVICTTLSSCIRLSIEQSFYSLPNRQTCCIIDEATQSTEQETLIPLILGISKIVLVGDPKQLPATTMSKTAKDFGYGLSLFTRIQRNFPENNPIRLLNVQYRMQPEIISYPNSSFYENKLINADCLRNEGFENLKPYLVFNINLNLNWGNVEYQNESEIECVVKLLSSIENLLGRKCTVGIITPYSLQKDALKLKLNTEKFDKKMEISINTVDSFQGQEKDVIIISYVRYDTNSFVADEKRMNVALTRAKYVLYVVGTNSLFKNCSVFCRLRDNAEARNLLYNINTFVTKEVLTQLIAKNKINR